MNCKEEPELTNLSITNNYVNIPEYLEESIDRIKLAILVFGPDPRTASDPASPLQKLAKKRIEVRDELRIQGHVAEFPEDLLVGSNKPPQGELLWYEAVLVENHDLVVLLAESPGSSAELGFFAGRTTLARKTQVFMNRAFESGLVADGGRGIVKLGGELNYFESPKDLDECNLWGAIKNLVRTVQRQKYFS